ncbi:MAG: hypothetical protein R2827_10180 [Bdellovibrionales bacterium]
MEPRLKGSKKWTELPDELQTQIIEALEETFPSQKKIGRFLCEGRIYKTEVLIQLGYLENGRLAQANAEVSIEYNFKKENVQHIIGMAVDAAGSLLDNYFKDPDEDLLGSGKASMWRANRCFFRFSTENSELEAEADKLLGMESDDGLVRGDTDSETIEPYSLLWAWTKTRTMNPPVRH